jgi:hypothetical protein
MVWNRPTPGKDPAVASILRRFLLLVLFLPGLVPVLPATAQDTARDAAAAYVPTPAAFGDGWTLASTGSLDLPTDLFRAGTLGVFTGPAGGRILAAVMLVTESRVAVRRSWEEATDLFHKYSGELAYDPDRDDILDRLPLPAGCVEAKRIDGTARQLGLDTGIPMGLTLCAADPDVILLVVVSGALGPLTGYEASDAVASLMLGAAGLPAATPTTG